MIFRNRQHAGQVLAQKLLKYQKHKPIVVALPRGGVPVALEVANVLDAPLEVLTVRKIGAPFQSELALGAICEHDEPFWNDPVMYQAGLEPDDLGKAVRTERKRIEQEIKLFRKSKKFPSVLRKTIIVVDDGLATGSTMSAAIRYLKKKNARKIIVAIPVAAASTAARLMRLGSEVMAIEVREDLISISQWYEDFSQVTDGEVMQLLFTQISESERIWNTTV